ncbi:MAG: calcium-binding protein, partial [Paenirhodobacter sp.]|uniref:calcium-binding protein n=1 Tax=Paenirhodobacter sp. TaxID=1965326 RepID=UPI003D111199
RVLFRSFFGADGGAGDDTLAGEAGDDALLGGSGDDSLDGGAGDDLLLDIAGADTLSGGEGDDLLSAIDRAGSDGADLLDGGAGEDFLWGDNGDTMTGGADADAFDLHYTSGDAAVQVTDFNAEEGDSLVISTAAWDSANDALSWEEGDDGLHVTINGETVAVLEGVAAPEDAGDLPVSVYDLSSGTSHGASFAGADITGTSGNDSLIGSNGDDTITGDDGRDTLLGEGGADWISGGNWDDSLLGGTGDDTLIGGAGDDYLDGGEGHDLLIGGTDATGAEWDTLVGSDGDTLAGGAYSDFVVQWSEGDDPVVVEGAHAYFGSFTVEVDGVSPDTTFETVEVGDELQVRLDGQLVTSVALPEGDITTLASVQLHDTATDTYIDATQVLDGSRVHALAATEITDPTAPTSEIAYTPGMAPITVTGLTADTLDNFQAVIVTPESDVDDGTVIEMNYVTTDTGVAVTMGGDVVLNLEGLTLDQVEQMNLFASAGPLPEYSVWGTPYSRFYHASIAGESLTGGDGAELLSGGDFLDTIEGGGGDDTLSGGAGDDWLDGGAGNDRINDGAGDDTVFGGDGNDSIREDRYAPIDGSIGMSDLYDGGEGDDVLAAIEGADTLLGGAGDDWLSAVDRVRIDYDAYPPTYGDLLEGGGGNDTLIGDVGDTLTGGDGADRFVLENEGYFEGAGDAVTITDFDPAEDVLQVNFFDVLNSEGYEPGDISYGLTLSDDGTSTLVQVDGDTAAVIVGLTPDQIPAGAIDFSAYDAGAWA